MSQTLLTKEKKITSAEIKEELNKVRNAPPWQENNNENKDATRPHGIGPREAYFNRLVNNSSNEKLKKKYEKSIENIETKSNIAISFEVVGSVWKKAEFKQEIPAVQKGGFFASAEEKSIKQAKKTFRNADVCTVREMASLKQYFKKGGHKPADSKGTADSAALDKFCGEVLKVSLKMKYFTDAYLADHISEMYEYSEKLTELGRLLKARGAYFASLPAYQRVRLEAKASYAEDVRKLIEKHLYCHGINVEENKGKKIPILRTEKENKALRHKEREQDAAVYNKMLRELQLRIVQGQEMRIAKAFLKDESYGGEGKMSDSDEKLSSNPAAFAVFGEELKTAYREMQKAFAFSDEKRAELKTLLGVYNEAASGEKQVIRKKIGLLNRQILFASEQGEKYSEVIDYFNGEKDVLQKDTLKLLEADGQKEILNAVNFRQIAECAADTIVADKRIKEKKDTLSEIKDLVRDIGDVSGNLGSESEWKEYRRGLLRENNRKFDFMYTADLARRQLTLWGARQAELEKELQETDKRIPFKKPALEELAEKRKRYREIEEENKERDRLKTDEAGQREEIKKEAEDFAGKNGMELAENKGLLSALPLGGAADPVFRALAKAALIKGQKAEGNDAISGLLKEGALPVLDYMRKLTAKDIAALRLRGRGDLLDRDFMKKYSYVSIGAHIDDFAKLLEGYGIALSDADLDQFNAVKAASKVMLPEYEDYMKKRDPMLSAVEGIEELKPATEFSSVAHRVLTNTDTDEAGNIQNKYRTGSIAKYRDKPMLAAIKDLIKEEESHLPSKKVDVADIFLDNKHGGEDLSGTEEKAVTAEKKPVEEKELSKGKSEIGEKQIEEEKAATQEKQAHSEEALGEKLAAKVSIPGMEEVYEQQTAQNCFSCSGTAMINQFISRRKKLNKVERFVDQGRMRAYRPMLKELPQDATEEDKRVFLSSVQDINRFAGSGKTSAGNMFEIGDFFFDTLEAQGISDVSLNRLTFSTPMPNNMSREAENSFKTMKSVFAKKIADIINGGGIAGVLSSEAKKAGERYSHYVTIMEIEGDRLKILDSSGYKGHAKEMTVDDFIKRGYTIEVNWLEDLKSPEEMKKKYPGLDYNEKTGYSEQLLDISNVFIAHTRGVTANKGGDELGEGMEGIGQMSYIPNPLRKVRTVSIDRYAR